MSICTSLICILTSVQFTPGQVIVGSLRKKVAAVANVKRSSLLEFSNPTKPTYINNGPQIQPRFGVNDINPISVAQQRILICLLFMHVILIVELAP